MKRLQMAWLILVSCCSLSFMVLQHTGGIKGQVTPTEGVDGVYLISGVDSIKVMNSQNGAFQLQGLKAGTYQLFIKTLVPYQEIRLNEVAVIDSTTTDVGQIKLLKR